MSLFHRKKQDLHPCPQCSQLLEPEAVECDMCGFDLREAQQPVAAAGGGVRPAVGAQS